MAQQDGSSISTSMDTDDINPRLHQRLAPYGVKVVVRKHQNGVNDASSAAAATANTGNVPVPPIPPQASTLASHWPGRHRAVVATRDLPAGAIIMQSTPYAFALMSVDGDDDDGEESVDGATTSATARCEWCNIRSGELSHSSPPSSSSSPTHPVPVKLLRCARCRHSWYCSSSCQLQAWRSFHSFECKELWTVKTKRKTLARLAREARMDLLLLGRCVRRQVKEQSDAHKEAVRKEQQSQLELEHAGAPLYSQLDDLLEMETLFEFIQACVDSHGKQQASGMKAASSTDRSNPSSSTSTSSSNSATATNSTPLPESLVLSMAQRLSDNTQLLLVGFRLGLFGPRVDASHVSSLLLPLLTSFQSNNFAITNGLLVANGGGIYPIGALLNHSCQPNCCITYQTYAQGESRELRGGESEMGGIQIQNQNQNQNQQQEKASYPSSATHVQSIRTLVPIRAGEELTHSYIDAAATTHRRRQQLLERYYFHCMCQRCVDEGGDDSLVDGGDDAVQSIERYPLYALERFLERDRDGRQLPDNVLTHSPVDKHASDSQAKLAAALSTRAYIDLLRSNQMWKDSTEIHMMEEIRTTDVQALEAEEMRRNKQEQTLISSALRLRLMHLQPYSLPVLASYSKLLQICLIKGDLFHATHACDRLCRIYRVIYGERKIRETEWKRWHKLHQIEKKEALQGRNKERQQRNGSAKDSDSKQDDDKLSDKLATTSISSSPSEEADDDIDLDEPDNVADYPSGSLPTHPLLGLQLYTLASLHVQCAQYSLALRTFQAALGILSITHGPGHALVRKLEEEIQQTRMEAKQMKLKDAATGDALKK